VSRGEDRTIALAIFAIAVFAAAARLRPVIDPDLPWHLFWAERVLEARTRNLVDVYQFTVPGKVFENIQWLGELVLYAFWRALGWAGLTIYCALASFISTLATAGLAFRVAGRRTWNAVTAVALATAAASIGFEARPQGLVLIAVPLALGWAYDFARAREPRQARIAALKLGVLDLVWSQMHGSFILLPALAAIPLAGTLVEGGLRRLARKAVLIPALALAILIAPSGLGHLGLIRSISHTDAVHYIQEMRALDPLELYPKHAGAFLWLDLLLLVGAVRTALRRSARMEDVGLALLGGMMTFTGRRFRVLWALLSVPWAAREDGIASKDQRSERGIARVAGVLAALLVVPIQIRASSTTDPGRGFGLGIDRDAYASDAATVLERARVEGNVLNEYDDGGWLELRLAPRIRIAIDGRTPPVFDEETFFRIRRATVEGGQALARFGAAHPFDLVLLRRNRPICRQLAADPRWRPAYLDRTRTLFVERTRSDPLPELSAIDPCRPEASIEAACGDPRADRRAIAGDLEALTGAAEDAPYPHLLSARFLLSCGGDPQAAVGEVKRALGSSMERPEVYALLAEALAKTGDAPGAIEAADRAIDLGGGKDVLAMRGRIRLSLGDAEGARRDLGRVVAELHDDTPPDVRLAYARALAATNDKERALLEAKRAVFVGADGADELVRELSGG
jgi:hypothetical protein